MIHLFSHVGPVILFFQIKISTMINKIAERVIHAHNYLLDLLVLWDT